MYPGIGGHARLKFLIGIGDVDLDSIDEFDALLGCLHGLRGEFGLRRDERDAAFVGFAREGVSYDAGALAEPYFAQIGFVHVGAQPDIVEVSDSDNRRAGGNVFAGFGVLGKYSSCDRRGDSDVAKARLVDGELLFGSLELGAGLRDLLDSWTLPEEFEALLGIADLGESDFVRGDDSVVLLGRNQILVVQRGVTLTVHTEALFVGASHRETGFALADLLGTGAVFEFGEILKGGGDIRAANSDLITKFETVQFGDGLTEFDWVAFVNETTLDAPGDLETDLRLGDLDIAGEAEEVGWLLLGGGVAFVSVISASDENDQQNRDDDLLAHVQIPRAPTSAKCVQMWGTVRV